mgnify:CR=1 FL=1
MKLSITFIYYIKYKSTFYYLILAETFSDTSYFLIDAVNFDGDSGCQIEPSVLAKWTKLTTVGRRKEGPWSKFLDVLPGSTETSTTR